MLNFWQIFIVRFINCLKWCFGIFEITDCVYVDLLCDHFVSFLSQYIEWIRTWECVFCFAWLEVSVCFWLHPSSLFRHPSPNPHPSTSPPVRRCGWWMAGLRWCLDQFRRKLVYSVYLITRHPLSLSLSNTQTHEQGKTHTRVFVVFLADEQPSV